MQLLRWPAQFMYIHFFNASGIGLSPLYCDHFWPVVPAPDDRWGWFWNNWYKEDWQGKPKYSEKTCTSPTLHTTNPTWPDGGLNPSCHGGKTATDRFFDIFVSKGIHSLCKPWRTWIERGGDYVEKWCSFVPHKKYVWFSFDSPKYIYCVQPIKLDISRLIGTLKNYHTVAKLRSFSAFSADSLLFLL
jgi:hypothetical protein